MKLIFHQRALLNRFSITQRAAGTTLNSFPATSTNLRPYRVTCKRSMHTSLHEAAYFPQDLFTVTDDLYDASKYGYRVVVPKTAVRRHSSSTMTNFNGEDDYTEYMQHHINTVDPRSLDILSSPEVLEILESQREWDCTLCDETYLATVDDPYLSDCEEMQDSWEHCTIGVEAKGRTFDATPSLDEKEM